MDTSTMQEFQINNITFNTDMLIDHALNAMKFAYTPYSKFQVGAAILDEEGTVFTGANIENASYGLAICAERTCIVSAASKGMRKIIAICAVGNTDEPISPCGACRQVIREFAHEDMVIILSNTKRDIKILSMEELLPYSFGPEHLGV